MKDKIISPVRSLANRSLIVELVVAVLFVLCLDVIFISRYGFNIPIHHWLISILNLVMIFGAVTFARKNKTRFIIYLILFSIFITVFVIDSTLFFYKRDVSSISMLFEGARQTMRFALRYNPIIAYDFLMWSFIIALIFGFIVLLKRIVFLHNETITKNYLRKWLYYGFMVSALLLSPLILNNRDTLTFAYPSDKSIFIQRFGSVTYHARDIANFATGRLQPILFASSYLEEINETIDFEVAPETDYFGILEGQNLIMIMCETCEQYAFDEELTPNYYHLLNNGYYFNNFYSATSAKTYDAEFKALTSAMYYSQSDNYYYRWGDNTYNNALPNMLNSVGYTSNSFHNWDGDFFNRKQIHPQFGFDYFHAKEDLIDLNPDHYYPLDSVMFEQFTPLMAPIQENPFFSFIITVTPHGPHHYREELDPYYALIDEHPLYNEREQEFKTLMAAQMDFDKGLGYLLDYLDENDLTDSTTIIIFSDHRNYSSQHITDQYTPNSHIPFEVDKVPLIIYSEKLGGAVKNTLSSQYDVTPTILDLLGIAHYHEFYYGQSLFLEDRDDRPIILSQSSWISEEMVVMDDLVVKGEITEERFLEVKLWIFDKIDFYDKIFVIDYFNGVDPIVNEETNQEN